MNGIGGVLETRLIGDAWLALDGRPVEPATRKGRLLLWILAVEERAVPRVELAELLWGRPRAPNLRQELHRLGVVPGADRWLSVGAEVRIDVTSDLGAFRRHLRAGRPGDALAVWRARLKQAWLELARRLSTAVDALAGDGGPPTRTAAPTWPSGWPMLRSAWRRWASRGRTARRTGRWATTTREGDGGGPGGCAAP